MSIAMILDTLDRNEIDVLARLVDNQVGMGVEYLWGKDLDVIRHKLREARTINDGTWDSGQRGDFTFSMFHRGNKVGAIKAMRIATGFGLKESKDIIDQAMHTSDGRLQLLITNATQEFFIRLHEACLQTTEVSVSSSNKHRLP